MSAARSLAVPLLLFTLAAPAQTAGPLVRVFHPAPPLPAYEVTTIKPFDQTLLSRPGAFISKDTVRDLVRSAYAFGTSRLPSAQVIGGQPWIDKDEYTIQSKPPADIEAAMQRMTYAEKFQREHAMQQSLLADRFHLKLHFEVRELPIYALVPAKGGLRLKVTAPPPPHDFTAPPSAQAPNQPLVPETFNIGTTAHGTMYVRAHAISMARFINILSANLNQTGDRPVADETGFAGYFDIDDLRWADPTAATSGEPSLETALEEKLGLKLILTKGSVEVVVIDSVDRPSAN
jgi:uncharacterized protein (TIGR03435 family)